MSKEKRTDKRLSKMSKALMATLILVSCFHLSPAVYAEGETEEPEIEIIVNEPQITAPTQSETDLGDIEVIETEETVDFVTCDNSKEKAAKTKKIEIVEENEIKEEVITASKNKAKKQDHEKHNGKKPAESGELYDLVEDLTDLSEDKIEEKVEEKVEEKIEEVSEDKNEEIENESVEVASEKAPEETSEKNTYTITWVVDGATVETDENVEEGTMPSYDGIAPVKESDGSYNYYFRGWTPALEEVSGNKTYTAEFEPVKLVTVTYYRKEKSAIVPVGSETVEEGQYTVKRLGISHDGAKDLAAWAYSSSTVTDREGVLPADKKFNELLSSGKIILPGTVVEVHSNLSLYAVFAKNEKVYDDLRMHLTYVWDLPEGTYYDEQGNVAAVVLPSDTKSYKYKEAYTVDTNYAGGTKVYTHNSDGEVDAEYTFSGWDKDNGTFDVADITVRGSWTKKSVETEKYSVTFYGWDGKEISTLTYKKGETLIVPVAVPEDDTFVFDGWEEELEMTVTRNAKYHARFKSAGEKDPEKDPEPKPEPDPEPKPESKPEPKPETKTETKVEVPVKKIINTAVK